MDDKLTIRPMRETDPLELAEKLAAQGWDWRLDTLNRYFSEQQAGKREVYVADVDGHPVGYATLVPQAKAGPFAGAGIPEVVDFNVLQTYQRRGIGNAILDAIEADVAQTHDRICLGVGLYTDYGIAQRMYVKRGYVPDGSGVWYQDKLLPPYESCRNDDDLVLYLSKDLRKEKGTCR